jgi:hypothetical protein
MNIDVVVVVVVLLFIRHPRTTRATIAVGARHTRRSPAHCLRILTGRPHNAKLLLSRQVFVIFSCVTFRLTSFFGDVVVATAFVSAELDKNICVNICFSR